MPTVTREQARRIDKLAMQDLGIPGVVLMENAGLNALAAIDRFMAEQGKELRRAVIFCGGGNNGGDGYVIARHLHNRGTSVQIIAHKPTDQLTGDAAIHATICRNMNLDIQPAPKIPSTLSTPDPNSSSISSFLNFQLSSFSPAPSIIIDALLGTGFRGQLRPDMLALIQAINATKSKPHAPKIVALDLPSGLDCDTGHPAQATIRADLTVTFVAAKQGFTNPAAQPYLGQVVVADIGTPPDILDRVTAI